MQVFLFQNVGEIISFKAVEIGLHIKEFAFKDKREALVLLPGQCPSWATWIFRPVRQASLWSSQWFL